MVPRHGRKPKSHNVFGARVGPVRCAGSSAHRIELMPALPFAGSSK